MLQVCLLNKSTAFSLLKNAELNCQYTVIVVVCTAVSYKKDCLPILPYYKTLLFFAAAKSRLLLCILLPCSVLLFIFYFEKKKFIKIKTDKNSQFLVLFDFFFFCNRPTKEFNTNIKVVLCVH